jgi:hypothetical protein
MPSLPRPLNSPLWILAARVRKLVAAARPACDRNEPREEAMPAIRRLLTPLTVLALAMPASAVDPPATVKPKLDVSGLLPALSGGSPDALAGALRGYLVQHLPEPLYESWPGWGNTINAACGIKWKGQGLEVHPEMMYKRQNDGLWRHVRAAAVTPADTLVLDIRDVRNPEAGRFTFTVFLAFDARVEFEQQRWASGVRLASSSAKARCRVKVTLQCEATYRLEDGQSWLPDAIFRLRVAKATVAYDNFVTEHAAGVGGEAARILGDAIRGGLHQWDPDLERDLLARANAAIEKAADTKEVRLSAFDLLKKKGWLSAP